ncbi:outer membrane protein [Persicirhabdus sediminis]|uniref:Outer membrane beta-barrel protein n=1 Tax=Persicirhabdus sediminis TaxID=454144 RepID=A0A8J7MEJ5_9BACT|nr:outer membrane beta-barrel protein [Persicirhabdus sediminis]MBK1790384.1 outer membrane beta-barrel protein [Persicirhabdus sediminis]
MKKNSIISLSAVALLAASAQAKDLDHSAYLPADDAGLSYVTVGGGQFIDDEIPYVFANFGYQLDAINSFSLEMFYFNDEQSYDGYGYFGSSDVDVFGIGAAYRASYSLTSSTQLYAGVGLGLAFINDSLIYKAPDMSSTYRGGGDTTSIYLDAVAGIEQRITEHWAFNVNLRYLWINDYDVKYPSDGAYEVYGDFEGDFNKFDNLFGIEAGLTYRF